MLAAAGGSGIALAGEIGARVPPPDGGGPAGSPSSVLVEVDQVPQVSSNTASMPPYSLLAGSRTNTTPLALSRSASRRQSSVRSESTGRPMARLASRNARAGSSVRCSASSTPSGSSEETTVSQRSSGP
jgi:hypothetical protein